MRRSSTARLIPGMLLLAGTLLSGCTLHEQTKGTRYGEIKHSLTPELLTLDKTYADADRDVTLTWNTDLRAAADDWGRGAMIDRPSRLTYFPMPH